MILSQRVARFPLLVLSHGLARFFTWVLSLATARSISSGSLHPLAISLEYCETSLVYAHGVRLLKVEVTFLHLAKTNKVVLVIVEMSNRRRVDYLVKLVAFSV